MPQLRFLIKHGLYTALENDIRNYLKKHSGKYYTSHEILKGISTSTSIISLQTALSGYSGGFSEVASHIGAVSSNLSKAGILSHSTQKCSVLNKYEDSFKM